MGAAATSLQFDFWERKLGQESLRQVRDSRTLQFRREWNSAASTLRREREAPMRGHKARGEWRLPSLSAVAAVSRVRLISSSWLRLHFSREPC